ncbi:hypothetical protein AB205_0032500, partial [Aquarana catesbeiana]
MFPRNEVEEGPSPYSIPQYNVTFPTNEEEILESGGHNVRNTSEEHLIVSPDYNAEDSNIVQYSPGGNPVTPNLHPRPSQLGRSMDPSNPEESSDGSHTKTIGSHSTDTSIDPSIPKRSSSSHEGVPTEESSLSCSEFRLWYTKRFTRTSSHFRVQSSVENVSPRKENYLYTRENTRVNVPIHVQSAGNVLIVNVNLLSTRGFTRSAGNASASKDQLRHTRENTRPNNRFQVQT